MNGFAIALFFSGVFWGHLCLYTLHSEWSLQSTYRPRTGVFTMAALYGPLAMFFIRI